MAILCATCSGVMKARSDLPKQLPRQSLKVYVEIVHCYCTNCYSCQLYIFCVKSLTLHHLCTFKSLQDEQCFDENANCVVIVRRDLRSRLYQRQVPTYLATDMHSSTLKYLNDVDNIMIATQCNASGNGVGSNCKC